MGAHAHHPDYGKPLEVEWLCRLCHEREHRPRSYPKRCRVCERAFVATGSNARYCSNACRQAAYRKRKLGLEAE